MTAPVEVAPKGAHQAMTRPASSVPGGSRWRGRPRVPAAGLPVGALTALVALVYALAALRMHANFHTYGFDLGLFGQEIDAVTQGHLPSSAIKGSSNTYSDHFNPAMALYGVCYLFSRSTAALLIGQSLIIAAAVPSIVAFSRRRDLGRPIVGWVLAIAAVLAYATWFGTQSAGMFGIHETPMLAVLLAIIVERADAHRWRQATGAVLALLLVREDAGLWIALLAGWLLLSQRQVKLGALWLLIGLVGLAGELSLVSALNPGGFNYFDYADLGASPGAVVTQMLNHPVATAQFAVEGAAKRNTVLCTFLPFLPALLSGPGALAAIGLALRLLSSRPVYWGLDFHYSIVLAPLLTLGMVDGLLRLAAIFAWAFRRIGKLRLATIAALTTTLTGAALIALFAVVQALVGPLVYAFAEPTTQASRDCQRAFDAIPDGADISASNGVSPHLVPRLNVRQWTGRADASWIAVLTQGADGPYGGSSASVLVSRDITALRSQGYRAVADLGTCVVLHRDPG